jgi:hypothetical protein
MPLLIVFDTFDLSTFFSQSSMLKLFFLLSLFCLAYFAEQKTCITTSANQNEFKPICTTEIDSFSKRLVYTSFDIEPDVIGGKAVLNRQFAQIQIDSIPPDYDTQFIVAFIIEADGQISNCRIIKDKTGGQVGKRILDIVKLNKWMPGTCKGKNVTTLKKEVLSFCSEDNK